MDFGKRLVKSVLGVVMALVMIVSLVPGMSFEAKADSTVTIRFHYSRSDGSYDSWNVWGWTSDVDGAWYSFSGKDDQGRGVATVTGVSGSATSFGFLVATKSWVKDGEKDRFLDLSGVSSGVVDVYLTQGSTSFTTNVNTSSFVLTGARVTDTNTITIDWSSKQSSIPNVNVYDVTTNQSRTDISAKNFVGDTSFSLKFTDKVYLGHEYKITYGSDTVYAKVDYDSEYFENNLTYDGNDLGATYTKTATTFKVWSPVADSISVLLFDKGTVNQGSVCTGEYALAGGTVATKGVWSKTLTGDYKNVYYVYKVVINGKTDYCMDPYSVAGCTVNDNYASYKSESTPKNSIMTGQRSMVTDLDSTDPSGWSKDKHVVTEKKTQASVYELSVRDFSSDPESGISKANRMKYLAFTEAGTTLRGEGNVKTGIDYLKALNVKYIQIMPSYDFAGTDEVTMENYNWGYNPVNYNIPEGSFASDPYDGNVRVNEYKQMVQAIHNNGMGVIMDVVYNHVNNDKTYCFETLVPGYFTRGSNGSGCGNDVASERKMVSKYIVDSVVYWANEYHIDGFRFDLVGLLDVGTMNALRAELNKINPNMLVYGEGWSLGTSPAKNIDLATQANTSKMPGVGMFNDVIRGDIRGGNDATTNGYASGDLSKTASLKSDLVASAWFTTDPTQIINYISCHDNYTLWDKVSATCSWAWDESKAKMNKLAGAINITAQGIPLFLGGEEFLRTKGGDENSYKSSDSVNMMDWSLAQDNADIVAYYAGLLEFRNNHDGLCMETRSDIDKYMSMLSTTDNIIAYTIDGNAPDEVADKILVAYNPNLQEKTLTLPSGEWKLCVNDTKAGTQVLGTVSGSLKMAGYSTYILVQGETKKPVVDDPQVYTPQVTLTAGDAQIMASWDGVDGADYYRVFTYINGAYKKIADTTKTTYTITGLSNGIKTGVIVLAYGYDKWSAYTTDDISYATPIGETIKTPTITLTAGNSQIKVAWSAVSKATKYRVFTYLNGSYKKIADTTNTSYTITGLTNGTKIGVVVLAYDGYKWSSYTTSDIKYATPVASSFITPQVTLKAQNGQIAVSWSKVSTATKYRVFTYLNGKYKTIGDTTATSYKIKGLTNGVKTGVIVLAYNGSKWSSYTTSDIKYATPTSAGVPSISVNAGNKQITVNWNAISGGTNYRVFTYLGGSFHKIGDTTKTSYTITGLTNGTTYGVLVLVYSDGQWQPYTMEDIVYATPKA